MLNRYGLVEADLPRKPDDEEHPAWAALGGHGPLNLHRGSVEHQNAMEVATDQARKWLHAKHGIKTNEFLGAGKFGRVHRTSDGHSVVKFDAEDSESRFANYARNHPVLSKISTLPHYHQSVTTDVEHPISGRKINALHREDLHDIEPEHRHAWNQFGLTVGNNAQGYLSRANQDVDAVHRSIDKAAQRHRVIFHPSQHEYLDRVVKDFHTMLNHGVMPCDLGGNWGRRGNGAVVVRDAGCYAAVKRRQKK